MGDKLKWFNIYSRSKIQTPQGEGDVMYAIGIPEEFYTKK